MTEKRLSTAKQTPGFNSAEVFSLLVTADNSDFVTWVIASKVTNHAEIPECWSCLAVA